MFGRATIRLGIGPHSSLTYFKPFFRTRIIPILPSEIKYVLYVRSGYAISCRYVVTVHRCVCIAWISSCSCNNLNVLQSCV